MVDYVTSSFDLGEYCTNVRCETENMGGNLMMYWIDPAGHLFIVDTDGTYDWDIGFNGHWVPKRNGNHGRVSPCSWSGTVGLHPRETHDIDHIDHRVMATVRFEDGIVVKSYPYRG